MSYEFQISAPNFGSNKQSEEIPAKLETNLTTFKIEQAIINQIDHWETHYPTSKSIDSSSEQFQQTRESIQVYNSGRSPLDGSIKKDNIDLAQYKIEFDPSEVNRLMSQLKQHLANDNFGLAWAESTFLKFSPSNNEEHPNIGTLYLSKDLQNGMEINHPDFFIHIYALAFQVDRLIKGLKGQFNSDGVMLNNLDNYTNDLLQPKMQESFEELNGLGKTSLISFARFHRSLVQEVFIGDYPIN